MPTRASKRATRRAERRKALIGRVGGIAAEVAGAELAELSDDALCGVFVALSRRLDREPGIRADWEELGCQWREREARRQTRVMAVFDGPVPKAVAARLRQAGLAQDRLLRRMWRGRADPEVIAPLVDAADGTLTVLDG